MKRTRVNEEKSLNFMENEVQNVDVKSKRYTLKKFKKQVQGITLIALVVTILFSYDEKIKCSNSKGFLLLTI